MTYTPQEISDALEFVEKYLDGIDTAVTIDSSDTPITTQISRGKTIMEEHSPNLEQIAEMGRYARTMIDSYLPSYRGSAPEELPTPDTPEQNKDITNRQQNYTNLSSVKKKYGNFFPKIREIKKDWKISQRE